MTEPLDRMVLGITEDLQIASTHVAMHFLRSSTERHSITLAHLTLYQTSPCFHLSAPSCLLKTLREKEKLLITSKFSFPCVFSARSENFLSFSWHLKLSSANSFNPFPHNGTFWCAWETSLLKTLGKGETTRNGDFSFSHRVFYRFE